MAMYAKEQERIHGVNDPGDENEFNLLLFLYFGCLIEKITKAYNVFLVMIFGENKGYFQRKPEVNRSVVLPK